MTMSNLTRRILSAAVLLPPILALIFLAPPLVFAASISLLSAFSGLEYASISLPKFYRYRKSITAFLSAAMTIAVGYWKIAPFAPIGVCICMIPVAMLGFMFRFDSIEKAAKAAIHTVFGALYCGTLWGCIVLLFNTNDQARTWVFLLLVCTVLGDTFAYGVGRLFGKRKFVPKISPGKTWAGVFGGIAGATAGVAIVFISFKSSTSFLLGIGIAVSLSAANQLGDLIESFLKRGFNVKDSSNIIPGHGGILDRCDSILLGSPLVLFFSTFITL